MGRKTKYIINGDNTINIEFGNVISEKVNKRVISMKYAIENSNILGIIETIPSYRSLLVYYDPFIVDYRELLLNLKVLEKDLNKVKDLKTKVINIPTCYGGEYGPDIEYVAKHNKISVEEVINYHSSREYLIYMLGFTPGFPYLGGINKKIATPRLNTPRVKIPAGSVGIGGTQTGIYPIESPGGWQLIGRTPLKLYDISSDEPFLLSPGYYLKFLPISKEKYLEIEDLVNKREYDPENSQIERSF